MALSGWWGTQGSSACLDSFERAPNLLTSSGALGFTSKSRYIFTLLYLDFMEYIDVLIDPQDPPPDLE